MAAHQRSHRAAALWLALAVVASGWLGGRSVAHAEQAAQPSEEVLERLVRPKLQNEVTVTYPEDLAASEEPPSGEVIVAFVVSTDGVPEEIAVQRGLHPTLDALAVEAVGRLRYTPASLDGEPVEVVQRMTIAFEPPATPEQPPPPTEGDTDTWDEPPSDEPTSAVDADGPVRINGNVVEAGQRTPIEGASVVIVPAAADAEVGTIKKKSYAAKAEPAWQQQLRTNAEGQFAAKGLPDGKVRVIVLAPGYERFESVESIPANEAISVRYYLMRLPSNPYRTVVRTTAEREEVARRTITADEINNLPGTQGDALKAIQNFPGVARSPFGIGLLVIRGTGPNDSAIFLGHHEIPTLFHFGGLTSVFNSDILDKIDFVPGNFDTRYGDATGGIIDVTPRAGRRDGFHGYIDSDVFDTGVLLEGPVGKGSFAVSGRRSYIDFLLPAAIPDDAGLDLTLAPRYYDYQGLFDYPVGGGELSARVFGSDDRTILVASNQNDIETDDRNRFETTQFFHRADLVYKKRKGPWSFLITPSYRLEFLQLGIGDLLRFDLRTHNLSVRAEAEHRLTRRAKWLVGTEFRTTWFRVDVEAPPVSANMTGPSGSISERLQSQIDGVTVNPAVYSTLSLDVTDRLSLYPGARVTVYTTPYEAATVDPRLRASIKLADRTYLKAGTGIYSQVPDPVEASEVFGNPAVAPERAWQNSLGVSQQFDYGITLDATAFANYLWDLSNASTALVRRGDRVVPENFANTGVGRVYGGEILLRKQLTSSFFGWLAYTLSRSERRLTPQDDWQLFVFDQTHILTLIGVFRLPKNWQIGARFRLVSGNPTTPVVGAKKDESVGLYVPVYGETNSERLPLFHQLDLRVDKKWIWKVVSLSLYLDVQNVYNQQNGEFYNYSYDYRQRNLITGLPIIPSIGTKLEF